MGEKRIKILGEVQLKSSSIKCLSCNHNIVRILSGV